jgi:hypothetical protein
MYKVEKFKMHQKETVFAIEELYENLCEYLKSIHKTNSENESMNFFNTHDNTTHLLLNAKE